MPLSICLIGATGRMGKRILSIALLDPEVTIASGCASPLSSSIGKDLSSLIGSSPIDILLEKEVDTAAKKGDVLIDFSTADALEKNLSAALANQKPLVLGTTGHTALAKEDIRNAAKKIPILFSPNFSFGMALCLDIAARMAKTMKGSIEIIETHHAQKKDRPSGSAMALAEAMSRNVILENTENSLRDPDSIMIQSIRTGNIIGEHEVIFSCEEERITLKHEALSRDAFAKGALMAAKFLVKQSPGLYSIRDLIHV